MRNRPCLVPCTLALSLVSALPLTAQLSGLGTQFWRSGLAGIDSPLQGDAELGAALAAGDFNCDGFDDLAIGIPRLDLLVIVEDAGGLLVLYGGPGGLGTSGSQFFDQLTPDLPEAPELGDLFAAALVAGNFNGDTCDDLAAGIPFEDIGAEPGEITNAGAVTILDGAQTGLEPGIYLTQDGDFGGPIAGVAEDDDRFGSSLAAADFDQDGFDDLAVGVPGEDLAGETDAGAVNVLFGSASSLRGDRDVVYFRGGGLSGSPETGEQLGFALAAGELWVFAGRELAIGCPFRDPAGDPADAGEVLVLGEVGEADPAVHVLRASSVTVAGEAEIEAHFGSALAVADFDGDVFGELAIGIPRQGDGAPEPLDHGAVVVHEIDTSNSQYITQSMLGPDAEEAFDLFGSTLAGGDFDADGYAELVIGVPSENLGGLINAGLVHVIPSSVSGFDLDGAVTWLQTLDPSEDDDSFGQALAVGRFAGNAGFDLALGVPGEQVGAAAAAGGVNVLYSRTLFRDGFESGDLSGWDLVVP